MKGLQARKGFGKIIAAAALALTLTVPAGMVNASASYNISSGGALTTQQLNSLVAANSQTQPASTTASYAWKVYKLVNQERAKAGLKPLTINKQLNASSLKKAKDMKIHKYFSHTSPYLGTPFQLMKSMGISYRYAGENIAMGQRTPQQVVKDWMNSKAHRAIIMSAKYKKVGVAYYQGEWVQHFMG